MVEKSGVEKFKVEKSGVERSRVEAWGWDVFQPFWQALKIFLGTSSLDEQPLNPLFSCTFLWFCSFWMVILPGNEKRKHQIVIIIYIYVDNFFIAWPRKKQHKNSHSRIEILEFFHYNSDLSLYFSRKQSSSCCLIFYVTKLKRRNSKILGTFSYIEIWVQPIHTCCN